MSRPSDDDPRPTKKCKRNSESSYIRLYGYDESSNTTPAPGTASDLLVYYLPTKALTESEITTLSTYACTIPTHSMIPWLCDLMYSKGTQDIDLWNEVLFDVWVNLEGYNS